MKRNSIISLWLVTNTDQISSQGFLLIRLLITPDFQFTPKYAKIQKAMITVTDMIYFGVVLSGSMLSKNMIESLWFYFLVLEHYRNHVCDFLHYYWNCYQWMLDTFVFCECFCFSFNVEHQVKGRAERMGPSWRSQSGLRRHLPRRPAPDRPPQVCWTQNRWHC